MPSSNQEKTRQGKTVVKSSTGTRTEAFHRSTATTALELLGLSGKNFWPMANAKYQNYDFLTALTLSDLCIENLDITLEVD